MELFQSASYPEGNFGGNQLLGDSMSLSPLYPGVTSDLHVSTIGDPPPDFRLASITPGKDRHLSGLSRPALDSDSRKNPVRVAPGPQSTGLPDHTVLAVAFTTPRAVKRPSTRRAVELLGPCYKTGRIPSHNQIT